MVTQWYHSVLFYLWTPHPDRTRRMCTCTANSTECLLHLWQPKAYFTQRVDTLCFLFFPKSKVTGQMKFARTVAPKWKGFHSLHFKNTKWFVGWDPCNKLCRKRRLYQEAKYVHTWHDIVTHTTGSGLRFLDLTLYSLHSYFPCVLPVCIGYRLCISFNQTPHVKKISGCFYHHIISIKATRSANGTVVVSNIQLIRD